MPEREDLRPSRGLATLLQGPRWRRAPGVAHTLTTHEGILPIISNFFGILVRMRHGDHAPPHIHVEYQGHRALVEVASGTVRAGTLPSKVATIVRDWCALHRQELLDDWQLAQAYEPLQLIAGADRD